MKKDIADKWVAALRSGNYEQTHGYLQRRREGKSVGFCCLGVLCDISGLGTWEEYEHRYKFVTKEDSGGFTADLPPDVKRWAGMKDSWGNYTTKDPIPVHGNLVSLNDSGFSFEKIATIIEKNWEQL